MEGAGTGNANSTVILSQQDASPFSLGPEAKKKKKKKKGGGGGGVKKNKKQKRKTEVRKGEKTKYPIEIKRKPVSGVSIWGNSRGQQGGHMENKNKGLECWVVKEEKHTKVLEG